MSDLLAISPSSSSAARKKEKKLGLLEEEAQGKTSSIP